jgi:integrase
MFKITQGFVRTWTSNGKRKDIYRPRLHISIHPTSRVTVTIAIKRGGISFREVIGRYPNNQLDAHQVAELQKRYRDWYLKLDADPSSLPKDLDRRAEREQEMEGDTAIDEAFSRGRVCDLVADYVERHVSTLKTAEAQLRMLRAPTGFDFDYVDPVTKQPTGRATGGGYLQNIWEDPLNNLTRQDLVDILRGIDKPILANRVRSLMMKLCSFGVEHGWLTASPATNLPRNKESRRHSILSDADIKVLWPELRDFHRFLLATGARRGEVATMRWEDVHDNVWTQPDPKQGVPHSLVLTPWIMGLLPDKSSTYVWTTRSSAHISACHVTSSFIKIRNQVGLPDKTVHDMRRTVGTRIAEMTGSAETADRVLGHALGGVTGRYVVTDWMDLKAGALAQWSDRLEAMVS